jgi:hypothetical protein
MLNDRDMRPAGPGLGVGETVGVVCGGVVPGVGTVGRSTGEPNEVTVQSRDRRSRKKAPETTTAATRMSATAAVSANLTRRRDTDTRPSIEGAAR